MEVMIPSQNLDFDFNSARSSPYVSPPSTPKRFGEYYFSAPTSPSHLSQFYKDFDEMLAAASDQSGGGLTSTVPFDWEEKPGTPKSSPVVIRHGDDFAFDVMSQDWETASLSAEELFDGGVIKPLKPPPRLQLPQAARISGNVASSPGKQVSQTRKIIQGAFSPRHKSKGSADPFAVAAAKAAAPPQRGRERGGLLSKSSSRRAARSLSPLRDTKYPWEEEKGEEEEEEEKDQRRNAKNSSVSSSVCSALSAATKGQRKWRLKDFFLFRSASEGRAADKDPLKKYTAAFSRRSSFSVIESPRSGSRRRGPVSAHELHYTVNRAVSEDLKKKTFLPYKQGILGRLAFNPAVHALANGFGFSRK